MKAGKFLKVLLVLLLLGMGAYLFLAMQLGPYGRGGDVFIPKGASVRQIAQQLAENGIIRNAWTFKLLARWKGLQAKLKPGEYEFNAGMTCQEVLEKIARGERVVHRLTVPEGYTFAQIATLIEGAGIAPASEVLKSFRDPTLLGLLSFPAISLEGYLYPATYEYDRETTASALLKQMIQKFKDSFSGSLEERRLQAGWTVPQVVTLASLIEKETGQAAERPLISSVFQNRLRVGMPLQTDPSVIYGIPNFDGNLRKEDLRNPHPYNTYMHVGLPPGPIASPGRASLEAALAPGNTNYLFFVAKGDGTHFFSATLDEHNAAVARYQLGKGLSAETQPGVHQPPRPASTPSPNAPLMKPVPMPRAPLPASPAGQQPMMKPIPMPRANPPPG